MQAGLVLLQTRIWVLSTGKAPRGLMTRVRVAESLFSWHRQVVRTAQKLPRFVSSVVQLPKIPSITLASSAYAWRPRFLTTRGLSNTLF